MKLTQQQRERQQDIIDIAEMGKKEGLTQEQIRKRVGKYLKYSRKNLKKEGEKL
jgi:hypothetical protein